ncbi:hypothetical protein [Bacillus tropicus]|uniref:hypothetical protein n=1 Tax=Bacillus tropicus TaxID=2026188 RepID=UPI003D2603D4
MKRYKIISATALAAMLVTSSSTFVSATEKENPRNKYKQPMYFHQTLFNKRKI